MSEWERRLQEFVDRVNPMGTQETALFLAYFLEVEDQGGVFTSYLLREAFRTARINPPSNMSQVIRRLIDADQAMVNDGSKPFSYVLTRNGVGQVTARLSDLSPELETRRTDEDAAFVSLDISRKLKEQVLTIIDQDEKGFIQEALSCLQPPVGAHRAAIVMAWAAVMDNIRTKVWSQGATQFNTEFQRRFNQPKQRAASHISDLEEYRDAQLLEIAEGLNVISKAVLKVLKGHLDIRNNCAHPSDYKPGIYRVQVFFEEAIEYVLAA